MTRRTIAVLLMVVLLSMLVVDLWQNPPNPFAAPTVIAISSGVHANGGFCSNFPQ